MQIGPRIRVGGTLGRIGQNIKREGGKALRNPWVQGGLGLLTGGATLPLLAGAAGGFLSENAGVGDVLRGGAQGFVAGGAGAGLRRLGTSALNSIGGNAASDVAGSAAGASGGAPAAVAPTTAAPSSVSGLSPIAPGAGAPASVLGQPVTSAGNLAKAVSTAADPSSSPGVFRSALNATGRFVRDNPTAAAMGLQGLGNVATAGAENRMNDAQTRLLGQRYELTEDDRRRRREQDQWFAENPMTPPPNTVAPNPYAPR